MKSYNESTLRSAILELHKTGINKEFINALWFCQLLEFNLKILLNLSVKHIRDKLRDDIIYYEPKITYETANLGDLIKYLSTFYSKSHHIQFMRKLKTAKDKRNAFIHKAFYITKGEFKMINFDENPQLNNEGIKIMNEWIKAYLDAQVDVLDNIKKFNTQKINIKDIQ